MKKVKAIMWALLEHMLGFFFYLISDQERDEIKEGLAAIIFSVVLGILIMAACLIGVSRSDNRVQRAMKSSNVYSIPLSEDDEKEIRGR